MQLYTDQAVEAVLRPAEGRYLQTRYYLKEEGPALVTVGRGENWSPLACKEVYAQAVRTAGELERSACAADLTAAAELGFPGLCAALEGLYGGGYKIRSALTGDVEPEMALYAQGEGFTPQQLQAASEVARSVIQARNLVNRPGNLLDPAGLAEALREIAEGLPVTAEIYGEEQLDRLDFRPCCRWPKAAAARIWRCCATPARRGAASVWALWARASPATPAATASSPANPWRA